MGKGNRMITVYKLPALAKQKERENRKLIVQLKKRKPGDLDRVTLELHRKAFQHLDCLDCANCCKTLGPRIIQRDIDRISKFLNLKPEEYFDKYLRIDEDGDFVFKTMPCPFLAEDNYCMVYEVRPKACAEYPHTNQRKIHTILDLILKNTQTCPAVLTIMEKLKTHYT